MTAGTLTSRPYRYGAGFLDRTTGLRFEAHHPQERPDLWHQYLDGAEARYRKFGIASLLGRPQLEAAEGVSLFFVGIDDEGVVRAGVRCHGPLDAMTASQALVEMATSPEADLLASVVADVLPFGVVEMKGAWGGLGADGMQTTAKALSRCCVHSLTWMRSELALGAVSDRIKEPMAACGARMVGEHAAPFPSERYRTVLMAWRRSQVMALAEPNQAALMRIEAHQLSCRPDTHRAAGRHPSTGRPAAVPRPPAPARHEEPAPPDDLAWRPIVLEMVHRSEREIVRTLRHDPTVRTVDRLADQRRELAALLPPIAAETAAEPERFVFYPWRRTLVRMLGPRAYRRLRLDRNRNKITLEEQERLGSLRVGVVGLSVGHPVAHVLAMEGLCGELRLADFDRLETSNLNRIPSTVLDLGLNKAVVAARRIAEVDPYLTIDILVQALDEANVERFVEGLDVVVDECDGLDAKVLLREVARRRRLPVLMETSDRGLFDVERFDLEADRPLFHGLLPELSSAEIAGLAPEAKVPYVLGILEPDQVSSRGAASLAEIGRTLATWPQLGGDVTLGAATVAAAVRRLGTDRPLPSGRIRVDLDETVATAATPSSVASRAESPPVPTGPADQPVPDDPVGAVAHAANLAPSGGNAQPWRFEGSDGALAILVDRDRTSTLDLAHRGSYVGIGAALLNARAAAAARGSLGPVTLFPDGPSGDRVAVLHLDDGEDAELAALYPMVAERCANRRRGEPAPIDPATATLLGREVRVEGATLHLVTDRGRLDQLAEVLGESERIRFLTPWLHAEMVGELRWPGIDSLERGIDVRTLELTPADQATLAVARRPEVMAHLADWGAGGALGAHARTAVTTASALAVVTVEGAEPSDFVTGGSAVERMWLAAQRAGVAVQPVSPVFIYAVDDADFETLGGERHADALRDLAGRFAELVGLGAEEHLALVLRLCRAPAPSARSLRAPLDDVLRRSPAASTNGGGGASTNGDAQNHFDADRNGHAEVAR
ncbi:MAG: Rv1355c family protein [Acidimicrobiales bacterium]